MVKFKNNLGNVFFYMGDLERSESYFTEAIGDATICLLLDNNLGLILNEINSEWLGSQYDILNASIEGTYSWPLGLNFIAPYIHTIDIKDACWKKTDGKRHLTYAPLGEGNVDYKQFFNLVYLFFMITGM